MLTNVWVLSSLWALSLAILFWGWRLASHYGRHLRARFRFFALRDRCVHLVAAGVIREEDEVFQFFYDLSNELARDAKELDITSWVRHATRATLALANAEERPKELARQQRVEELVRAVKGPPKAFQELVRDFYDAIRASMVESSTIVGISVWCSRIHGLQQVGWLMFVGRVVGVVTAEINRYLRRAASRQQVLAVYERADDLTRALQAA